MSLEEIIRTIVAAISIATTGLVCWHWVRPRVRARRLERESIATVLLGRPAVPANPITGATAVPAVPSIGQLVADIHHELHPNSGTSLADAVGRTEAAQARTEAAVEELRNDVGVVKERQARDYGLLDNHGARLARIEELLAGELHAAHDTIATAAEANKQVLSTVETALKAQLPDDDPSAA